jgi:hypothetical protein
VAVTFNDLDKKIVASLVADAQGVDCQDARSALEAVAATRMIEREEDGYPTGSLNRVD